jgi:hypothetical protein
VHEFLRCRYVTAVAALLRHGTTNLYLFCFQGILFAYPGLGRAITPSQLLNDRLCGFAGRDFIANIDGATAHDCHPLLKLGQNAQAPRMVAGRSIESAAVMLRFTGAELRRRLLDLRKVKKPHGAEPV